MNLQRALEIPIVSSVSEANLRFLAESAKGCTRILELGSFHGRSARAMLDNSNAHIWCVDSWRGASGDTQVGKRPTEDDFNTFLGNLKDVLHRVTVLKSYTYEVVSQLQKDFFDLVFIDADHSYEAVRFDIINYAPKVKLGGLLCGHDYSRNWPGVVRAVQELLTAPQTSGSVLWWARREKGWLFTRQLTS
jgi:predicted O-methyltransferase YrrM